MKQTLTRALPIVAAAYGRKFGVRVAVGGDRACTNGSLIQLPSIAETEIGRMAAWGYLSHEAAHVRFTDLPVMDDAAQGGPVLRFLCNVLEDVRIERALVARYPGTAATLQAAVELLVSTGGMPPAKDDDSSERALCQAVLSLVRYRYCRQAVLAGQAAASESVLRARFGEARVDRLNALLLRVPALGSSREALDLAREVLALFADDSSGDQGQSGGESGDQTDGEAGDQSADQGGDQSGNEADDQSGGKSSDQPGEEAGDQSSGNASDQSSEDTGDRSGGNPGDQSGDEAADQSGNEAGEAGDKVGDEPGEEAADQSADDACTQPGEQMATKSSRQGDAATGASNGSATIEATGTDIPATFDEMLEEVLEDAAAEPSTSMETLPVRGNPPTSTPTGTERGRRVKSESLALRTRLQALVEAHAQERRRIGLSGSRVAGKHLARTAVGDGRIFARNRQVIAPNTAIHLLLDMSSSMRGPRAALAQDAALALALALDPVAGVSLAVTAFPGRGQANTVTPLVEHGQRAQQCAPRFALSAFGGTPMTGALWYAAADLLAQRVDRRVIVVLTDGMPNHLPSTLNIRQRANAAGIETIGIGLFIDVSGIFPVAVEISVLGQLKTELFRIAEHLLLT